MRGFCTNLWIGSLGFIRDGNNVEYCLRIVVVIGYNWNKREVICILDGRYGGILLLEFFGF